MGQIVDGTHNWTPSRAFLGKGQAQEDSMTEAQTPQWVDAAPFRTHLRHLISSSGLSGREIATLMGLPPGAVRSLLLGRCGRPVRRMSRDIAGLLLNLTPGILARAAVEQLPPHEARRRVRSLMKRGWRVEELASYLRLPVAEVEELARGKATSCRALVLVRLHIAPTNGPSQRDAEAQPQLTRAA
jgi:hypothetical protein